MAGGVVSELFAIAIAPPLSKRRDEWFASLGAGKLDAEILAEIPVRRFECRISASAISISRNRKPRPGNLSIEDAAVAVSDS
jgi:hypothetical protein